MLSDLEIMMAAGHPKREAEKHLKDGSLIYSDLEEHFDSYMDEFFTTTMNRTRRMELLSSAG